MRTTSGRPRLQAELDVLVAELARAFGLGGRERKASSAAEKARLNVTRALRAAVAKLTEALPEPGAVLDRRVRTGLFCAYQPHPDDEVVWSVQSRVNGTGADAERLQGMETKLDEIADGIYRLSTYVPEVAPPAGFTFNQFLIAADEPLLFHTGPRGMFPLVAEAVARVVPVESAALDHLRPRRGRRVRLDEHVAGRRAARRRWPTAASGCDVSLNDLCDRPPLPMADGEVIDLGGKRVRHIDTPHVPHGWEARVLYEETTGTLLCGDLFTHLGGGPALTTDDIVEPAMAAEAMFRGSSPGPRHRRRHASPRRPVTRPPWR